MDDLILQLLLIRVRHDDDARRPTIRGAIGREIPINPSFDATPNH
jgi:hypothetical protein